MNYTSTIGQLGEEVASQYLLKNGYTIIERNFRKPWGEIDIIARDKKKTLVFVEVKAMKKIESLSPEDNVTSAKLRKLKKTAAGYAAAHHELVNNDRGWRIDLIAIDILENKNDGGEPYLIRHFENIS